jgi:hypothetical protein
MGVLASLLKSVREGEKGHAYHLTLDLEAGVVRFRFRCHDAQGTWAWRNDEAVTPLPERHLARLRAGAALLAPTLREVVATSGGRTAVLDLALAVTAIQPCRLGNVERYSWMGVHSQSPPRQWPPPRWRGRASR